MSRAYIIISEFSGKFMIFMKNFTMPSHFALFPKTDIFTTGFGVVVSTLTVTQIFFPLSFITITICIVINSVSFSQIIDPRTFVFGAVKINKSSLTVFFVFNIFADVSTTVFEFICSLTMAFAVLIIALINIFIF